MGWTVWIPTLITVGLAILIFTAKHKIKAEIERSVRHKFDAKIETLRGDLRKNEEEFKSELRLKETEISALKDGVLGGRVNRQAMLDKRRLETVERVWAAVTELAPFKLVSALMVSIKFDAAAEAASRDPKVRSVFTTIGLPGSGKMPENPAKNERPFVSPIAWALLSAYQAVLTVSALQMKILELGAEGASSLINTEKVKTLLKAALPHQTEFIEKYDNTSYYLLLEELEEKLLGELRKMLDGVETDEAAIVQSAKIMKAVDEVAADNASQIVKNEEMKFAASSEK